MDQIWTISEMIALALALRPRDAARCTNGDRVRGCSTPVFTAVRLDDGTVLPLGKRNNRYGAGYARVSSRRQQQDGWSQEDQITRIVRYFVERGEAFRIFSDAGLPGSLAYHDADGSDGLSRRLALKRAQRYEVAYRKIFLENPRYAVFLPQMEAHLAHTLEAIRSGKGNFTLDEGEDESAPRMGRPSSAATFRPGLTTLVECLGDIHSLVTTDLSRISRSQILFADFVERLNHHGVSVTGLMEDLSWVGGTGDVGADIVAYVLSRLAEHRLGELVINILRGQVTKLEAGEASGRVPSWLTVDSDGTTRFNERAEVVRRIVDMALQGTASIRIAITLAQEGVPVFGKNGKGQDGTWVSKSASQWTTGTIYKILLNPALRGKQVLFGIEWDVFPRLVTEDEWALLQARQASRSKAYPKRINRYLASQLLRCSCGYKMTHRPIAAPTDHYACIMPLAIRKLVSDAKHVALNQNEVERFIHELMQFDPGTVVGIWRDTLERNRIQEDLVRLQAQRQNLKERLPQEEAQALTEARTKARLIDEEDEDIVAAITRRLLAPLIRQQDEIDAEILERQRRLDAILPSDEIASIEKRVQAWTSLSVDAQNQLLLTLFKEWRIEGVPPNEYIVPVLNTLEETTLPPIYLPTKIHGRNVIRRFPSVADWIDSWLVNLYGADNKEN